MKKYLLFFLTASLSFATAQQNVGIGTATPDSSAVLDVNSVNKGMLIPRLSTAQRLAVTNAATGLLVFDTDKGTVMFFDGTSWRAMSFTDENKTDPQSRSSAEPSLSAGFGTRVSMSGNYAIIGAPQYGQSGLINMGLAYIFNKTSGGWKEVARLAAPDSAEGDLFGGAVAISGDYAITGSSNKTWQSSRQGKAYVYHRVGTAWIFDTAFQNLNGLSNDNFGWAVGVCAFNTGGPAIAIGSPHSGLAEPINGGKVFFYTKTGSTWGLVQEITPPDIKVGDRYGSAITMDTDYVAIGTPGQRNTNNAIGAGAVYIYAFGGGVWNFQQTLQGSAAGGEFGTAISLASKMLAVGAPFATGQNATSSYVYIFTRFGTSWSNSASLYINNYEVVPNAGPDVSIINLLFGISVSLSGNTLLVGAAGGFDYPNGNLINNPVTTGAVYVYKNLSGITFTRNNVIKSDFPGAGDFFGETVSASGNNYIIGSPHATVNGLVNAGNVYFGN